MRYVVVGAGAVGGVVGAGLHLAGEDVVLVARGAHHDAIRRHGLRLDTPGASTVVTVPVVERPEALDLRPDDVVLLGVKSQDTEAALGELASCASSEVVVCCLQNGVENERRALRWFANVLGVVVMAPTSHLVPGVVAAYSAPTRGILDLGRYPSGADARAWEIAAAFRRAQFSAHAVEDIMRWKYRKLLMNLGNVVEALCGPGDDRRALHARIVAEGSACLDAAGIDVASVDEDRARREGVVNPGAIDGRLRGGGSSWQSLARGAGSIETDFLNGEIVMLGRLVGVATPANAAACVLARRAVREGRAPGSFAGAEVLALADGIS